MQQPTTIITVKFRTPVGTLVYTGQHNFGTPHGDGEVVCEGICSYKGKFENGVAKAGILTQLKDGTEFSFSYVHGNRVCTKVTKRDGHVYEGSFKEYRLHGHGKFSLGTYLYEGQFRDGQKHGRGKEITDARIIEGTWEYDHLVGKIKFTAKSSAPRNAISGEADITGSYYSTKGTAKSADGAFYEGEMIATIPHGPGKLTCSDGKVAEGQFRFGLPHGKVIITKPTPEGTIRYDGNVFQGASHGYGIRTSKDEIYKGQFFDGKMHGKGILTQGDSHYEVEYFAGELLKKTPVKADTVLPEAKKTASPGDLVTDLTDVDDGVCLTDIGEKRARGELEQGDKKRVRVPLE